MQPFVLTHDALWKADAAERADGLTVKAVGLRFRVFRVGTRRVLGSPSVRRLRRRVDDVDVGCRLARRSDRYAL